MGVGPFVDDSALIKVQGFFQVFSDIQYQGLGKSRTDYL